VNHSKRKSGMNSVLIWVTVDGQVSAIRSVSGIRVTVEEEVFQCTDSQVTLTT